LKRYRDVQIKVRQKVAKFGKLTKNKRPNEETKVSKANK
jgi:hypothetical protein